MIDPEEEKPAETPEEIHEEGMERYREAKRAWEQIHTTWRDDTRFAYGDQWDAKAKSKRKSRPCLVSNKTLGHIRFVVNNARASTPIGRVYPLSEGANKETAAILDGLMLTIQRRSRAKNAYTQALEAMLTGGFGVWRICPRYRHNGDADIRIERVIDPTRHYPDPNADMQLLQDAQYWIVESEIPRASFAKLYPGKDDSSPDSKLKEWFSSKAVKVLEYWRIHGGRIEQHILSGTEVLKSVTDYPGRHLPFVWVPGREVRFDDVREFRGMVPDIRDDARLVNLTKSEIADYMSRVHRPQWLLESGMIGDYQAVWNSPNLGDANYLPYVSKDGSKPTQINPPSPPTAFIQVGDTTDADMRQIVGIRDPIKDIPSSQSGKAIALQQSASDMGSFAWIDNLNDSINWSDEIILDLIPHYYSQRQMVELTGRDGQVKTALINAHYHDPDLDEWVCHNLTEGEYGVVLSTGPSFESQRKEAQSLLVDLAGKSQAIQEVGMDMVVRTMDFDGADALADRLQATIPPNILQAGQTGGNAQSKLAAAQAQLREAQAQAQQMDEHIKQLDAQIADLSQKADGTQTDLQLKARAQDLDLQKHQASLATDLQKHRETLAMQSQSLQAKTSVDIGKIVAQGQQHRETLAAQDDRLIAQAHIDQTLQDHKAEDAIVASTLHERHERNEA